MTLVPVRTLSLDQSAVGHAEYSTFLCCYREGSTPKGGHDTGGGRGRGGEGGGGKGVLGVGERKKRRLCKTEFEHLQQMSTFNVNHLKNL